jgi:hypothetical protein
MRDLLEKFQKMEMRISRERGPFHLFALFLPEDAANLWDLVISAPWADDNESEARRFMVRQLQKDFTTQEILRLSRTVFIPTDFEGLEELYEEHPVEHGKAILRNREFGLLFVEKGYIITCRPPAAKAA